jgi:hypothetical protein
VGGTTNTGTALHFDASGGTMNATVTGGTFTGHNVLVNLSIATSGVLTFDVNGISGPRNRSSGINLFSNANATGSMSGRIRNNVIGASGVTDSGSYVGSNIVIGNEANTTANAAPITVSITGNTLHQARSFQLIKIDQGIGANASPTFATITGNTFGRAGGERAIAFQQNLGTATSCVDLQGNNFIGPIAGNAGDGTIIRLRQNSTGTFNVRQTSVADIFSNNTWPASHPLGGTYNSGNFFASGGTLTFNGGVCPQP